MKEKIFLLFFIIGFAYLGLINKRQEKKIKLRACVSKGEKLIFLIFIGIFIYISYNYRKDIYGYLAVAVTIIVFYSYIYLRGLGTEGLYSSSGRGLFIREFKPEDIRYLKLDISRRRDGALALEIKTDSRRVIEYFSPEDREEIEKIIGAWPRI